MDDFCWVTGPGLCGKLTFDLPIAEVLITAAVSALVTFFTIYFSVRLAKKQAEATLAEAAFARLRGACIIIADDAARAFAEPLAQPWEPSAPAMMAYYDLENSGLTGGNVAGEWAHTLVTYLKFIQIQEIQLDPRKQPIHGIGVSAAGISSDVLTALLKWLDSPDELTPVLAAEVTQMKAFWQEDNSSNR